METGGQFLRDSPWAPLEEGAAVEGAGLEIELTAASMSSSAAAVLSSRMDEALPSVVLPSV